MGQISKTTKAITLHVKNSIPTIVSGSFDLQQEIQVLSNNIITLENQLVTFPEGKKKLIIQDNLLAAAYGLEILKDVVNNPNSQYSSVIPGSLASS